MLERLGYSAEMGTTDPFLTFNARRALARFWTVPIGQLHPPRVDQTGHSLARINRRLWRQVWCVCPVCHATVAARLSSNGRNISICCHRTIGPAAPYLWPNSKRSGWTKTGPIWCAGHGSHRNRDIDAPQIKITGANLVQPTNGETPRPAFFMNVVLGGPDGGKTSRNVG